jgi:Phospholipase_D-nuclease N-terminal
VLALTTFWEVFFILLIVVPLLALWIYAFVDIFRRDDIGGGAKALWVVLVILLPYFGTLIYFFVKPMTRALRT